jgi:lipopolysaccharide transport system permease protein
MESLTTAESHSAGQRIETVIRPPKRWPSLGLAELWQYRELLYFLAKREIQVRYKQSALGIGWAVLQPLAMTVVLGIVFGQLARVDSGELPYPVFALAGLVPWFFFANSLSQGTSSVVKDAPLVTKVYFPRVLLPISKVLWLTLDLAIAMVLVIALGLVYGQGLELTALLAPLFLAVAVLAALGAAMFLGAANVPYRDIGVVAPLLIQIGIFVSPVVYPASLVPDGWQYAYAINPMSSVIEGVRWALFGAPGPEIGIVMISLGSALLMVAAGYLYFRRVERVLPDII